MSQPRVTAPNGLAAALAEREPLSAGERRGVVGLIAGAHVVALWGLLQVDAVRDAVREVAPLMVDMIAPPKPEQPPPPPPPPPPPTLRPRKPVPAEPPLIAAPLPVPQPAETFTAPAPPPEPAPVVVAAAPAPPAPPAPPVPPPQPKLVSITAVSWQVEPVAEVPRLSRRAREQGRVELRVVFDAHGAPVRISVRSSSGYPRLDDAAVASIGRSRMKPFVENGVAIPIQVTVPFEFTVDN